MIQNTIHNTIIAGGGKFQTNFQTQSIRQWNQAALICFCHSRLFPTQTLDTIVFFGLDQQHRYRLSS